MRSQTLLTNMEKVVISEIAKGKTSQEAADALCVSKKTVQFHMSNTCRKLGTSNRVQAINAAREFGEIR